MKRVAVSRLVRSVALLLASSSLASCSTGNFDNNECDADAQCAEVFGLGSACDAGYCTDPMTCSVNTECHAAFGQALVCQQGRCQAAAKEPRCSLSEPPELVGQIPNVDPNRILLGSVFKLDTPKELARADSVRLAVREINKFGLGARTLGVLICNNDSDGNADNDAAETAELVEYLASSIGVRAIVGPSSSSNTTVAVNTLLAGKLRTVVVSPSATSSALTNLLDRFDPERDPFGLLWRTCPSDALQGNVLAATLRDKAITTVAVVYQNDAYGQGLDENFRQEFVADGRKAVSFSFETSETDLGEALANLESTAGIEAVLIISSDAKRSVRILDVLSGRQTIRSLPFFLTDGSKDKTVLLAPENSPGVKAIVANVFGTAPASPSGLVYDSFRNGLSSQFKTDAGAFSFLAQSYDATYLTAYAHAYASPTNAYFDGYDVAEGLSRLSKGKAVNVGPSGLSTAVSALRVDPKEINVTGTSGPLDMDPVTGEAPGPIEVWKVNATMDGFETVSVVTP